MKTRLIATLLACTGATGLAAPAQAQMDPFIGQISMVGYNFCPRGWAEADGQLLPISQNQALFALYGTYYGGDGRTTFALPDLRGKAPVHSSRERPQGSKSDEQRAQTASDDDGVTVPGSVAIRYCVALQGIFPSRN